MRIVFAPRAIESLRDAPSAVRAAFTKQMGLLAENLRHPSIRAKKYDDARNIWQGRVNGDWRFYFVIAGDAITILKVIPHPK